MKPRVLSPVILAAAVLAPAGCEIVAGIDDRTAFDAGTTSGGTTSSDGGAGAGGSSSGNGGSGAEGGAAGAPGRVVCLTDDPVDASLGSSTHPSTLAYSDAVGRWSLAWRAPFTPIFFNALDDAGTLEHDADQAAVTPGENEELGEPRVLSAFDQVALAYGVLPDPEGEGTAVLRLIDPVSGVTQGSPATGASAAVAFAQPPSIAGLALRAGADLESSTFVAVAREPTAIPAPAVVNWFTGAPAFTDSEIIADTLNASVAYAPASDVFGVAYIDQASDGKLAIYDASSRALIDEHDFTVAADRPAPNGRQSMDVMALGDRFAIAWMDDRFDPPETEIFLTMISAISGARTAGAVRVSHGALAEKPRLLSHGHTIALAWLQVVDGIQQVLLRRFDRDLEPLGETVVVTASAGFTPTPVTFGFALEAPGRYALSLGPEFGALQLLRVACSN